MGQTVRSIINPPFGGMLNPAMFMPLGPHFCRLLGLLFWYGYGDGTCGRRGVFKRRWGNKEIWHSRKSHTVV